MSCARTARPFPLRSGGGPFIVPVGWGRLPALVPVELLGALMGLNGVAVCGVASADCRYYSAGVVGWLI